MLLIKNILFRQNANLSISFNNPMFIWFPMVSSVYTNPVWHRFSIGSIGPAKSQTPLFLTREWRFLPYVVFPQLGSIVAIANYPNQPKKMRHATWIASKCCIQRSWQIHMSHRKTPAIPPLKVMPYPHTSFSFKRYPRKLPYTSFLYKRVVSNSIVPSQIWICWCFFREPWVSEIAHLDRS